MVTRDDVVVTLAARHVDVLQHLFEHAGQIVSKDSLIEAAWRDVAVTDNSLEQAISSLRRQLGDDLPLETIPRQGYRLNASVTRHARRHSDEELDAILAPHRAWLEGRAALETLGVEGAATAQSAFERALTVSPVSANAHVGLANALVFRYEARRTDAAPPRELIERALHHAYEGCRLAPDWAEAWATAGFVRSVAGEPLEAVVLLRRALELEATNWRHLVRAAWVSWGEERLRACARAQQLLPGLVMAHELAAMVHIARQAFDAAERELEAGIYVQARQDGNRFATVGLHWMRGLVRWHRGETDAACADFERELQAEHAGHLYARECAANAWYALAAIAWHAGNHIDAVLARAEIAQRAPAHRGAALLDAVMAGTPFAQIARQAADTIADELREMVPGSAYALLPLDPFLRPTHDTGTWESVLAQLRSRAA